MDWGGYFFLDTSKRRIKYVAAPYNFSDRNQAFVLYESSDFISSFTRCVDEFGTSYYVICDEDKILKVMKLTSFTKDKKNFSRLEVDKEYFVNDTFKGDNSFKYIKHMVYNKFEGVVCQEKGTDKKEGLEIDLNYTGFDEETVTSQFPLLHKNLLFYIGKDEEDSTKDVGLILPAYNDPVNP